MTHYTAGKFGFARRRSASSSNYRVRKHLWFSHVVSRHSQKGQKNIDRIVGRFCLLHHYYRRHRQAQGKQSEQMVQVLCQLVQLLATVSTAEFGDTSS